MSLALLPSSKRTRRPGGNARHFRVWADMGAGRVAVSVRFSTAGVEMRKWHSRRVWFLNLGEAVGILARAAQVREAQRRLGRQGA
jgi:hypothetical protein